MKYVRIDGHRVPVWMAVGNFGYQPPHDFTVEPIRSADRSCFFRGVKLDRLPSILQFGVDVSPPNAPLYLTNDFDKAWEYGGGAKAIMAINVDRTLKTSVDLNSDLSETEIAELKRIYPYEHDFDGEIVLSRAEDKFRAGCSAEYLYGRWIPGDPFAALHSIFVYGSESDLSPYLDMLLKPSSQ